MISLNTPFLRGNEKKYLSEVIDSNWLARGTFNEQFEDKFSKFCGTIYGLSVTSGTVAVQVLLMAAGMRDEKVAVPAYTCMSVAQATVHSGAIPVFVDVEPQTFGIDFQSLKRMYEKEPFKAVLLNHLYGYIARDTFIIKDWCEKNGVLLLEDASEAHGAELNGERAGSIGEGAAFSMRSEKMIGVGEGGMVVTGSKDLWDKAYYFINDARPSNKIRYWTTDRGWNFFMPNALAAIGLAQVEQIDEIIQRKRTIGKLYMEQFEKRGNYLSPMNILPDSDPVYWLNVALLADKTIIREDFITALYDKGIESRPGFYPLNLLPAYRNFPTDETPVAWLVGRQAVAFPSNVFMTSEDINYVFSVADTLI